MLELTFGQQLALAIVDKLALGGALVGVGYVANRYLESHKTRQVFAAEVARRRLEAIGAVWEGLAGYEHAAYLAITRAVAVLAEDVRASGVALPSPLPRDARKIAKLLVPHRDHSLTAKGRAKLNTITAELTPALHAKADDLSRLLSEQRFWLGNDIYKRLTAYQRAIHRTFRMIKPSSIREYEKAYREMAKKREDVELIAANLLS
jgi:hypothetical protein